MNTTNPMRLTLTPHRVSDSSHVQMAYLSHRPGAHGPPVGTPVFSSLLQTFGTLVPCADSCLEHALASHWHRVHSTRPCRNGTREPGKPSCAEPGEAADRCGSGRRGPDHTPSFSGNLPEARPARRHLSALRRRAPSRQTRCGCLEILAATANRVPQLGGDGQRQA